MAKFQISVLNPKNGVKSLLDYDNMTSELNDAETGQPIGRRFEHPVRKVAPTVSKETPLGKVSPRVLKISLGLGCNYECEYCSQRFVPRAGETNKNDITPFLAGLDSWVTTPPEQIEFWGGEPFVYWKTLKPLAEALRAKFPDALLSTITNGSLLTLEINAWLDEMGFAVGMSHDGPGQWVRGPDPLADAEVRANILDLYRRLNPSGRVSFNAMMNKNNVSRAAVQAFFVELTGDPDVVIGEGSFVDAYDPGGLANSLQPEEFGAYRRQAFQEIRSGGAKNFINLSDKITGFVKSIETARPAKALSQKCGMDKTDAAAVDLRGNVLTCQNVSAASVAPNGEAHQIGHVSRFSEVKLNTTTHWSKRKECPECPVLQICQGACMFLQDELWSATCDNSYSDAIPVFTAAIEVLTGCIPLHIEGNIPDNRKNMFEPVAGHEVIRARKPFPVSVVSAPLASL